MSDQFVSIIRTYVPLGVGALLTWLGVRFGVVVPEDASAALTAGLVALVSALYYTVARALEARWPWFGVFLGATRQPSYAKPLPAREPAPE